MNEKDMRELKLFAAHMRKLIIDGVYQAQSGHPGGSLSCTDILTYLYVQRLNVDPEKPKDPKRDRFVLSKGHCAPALYAVLGLKGYFPPSEINSFRKCSAILQGHPCMESVPGVDMSTGSLGQGISVAVGMALAGKLDQAAYRVFSVLGDGELQEGQVWEAFTAAAHYKLDNLTAFIDLNGLQIDGRTKDVMNLGSVPQRMVAFGWHVIEIDGHDFLAIKKAVSDAESTTGRPTMVVAHTIKGKGVSFMENQVDWHGKAPSDEEYQAASKELDAAIAALEDKQ